MGFEPLLDRFWTDFGSILEAKLAQKSIQEGFQTDVKTNIRKTSKKEPNMSQHRPPRGAEVADLGPQGAGSFDGETEVPDLGGRGDPPI